MKIDQTERGFAIAHFQDVNGNDCTIQKSSIATDDFIWLGCDKLTLKRFEAGIGWSVVELVDIHPSGPYYVSNTRMHLSRTQAAELIPLLQRFVDTGELS